jgi:hypothetical protein
MHGFILITGGLVSLALVTQLQQLAKLCQQTAA